MSEGTQKADLAITEHGPQTSNPGEIKVILDRPAGDAARTGGEFERLEKLTEKLTHVPKHELDEKLKRD